MTNVPNVQFKSKIFVSGAVMTLTGLHIGGNSTEMGIGGADSIVIRDPITNFPYIPGSSMRGKMRSLLERVRGEMTIKLKNARVPEVRHVNDLAEPFAQGASLDSAGPSSDPNALSTKLFGVAIDKQESEKIENVIPQRLVVRDAKLINPERLEKAKNTDMPMTEVKTEVAIDRITSKANPRQIERVPAGAAFGFEFILNLYGDDDEKEYLDTLFECMRLLQGDYLGGHGSRGYGRVRFNVESVTQKKAEDYRENRDPQAFDIEIPPDLKFNEADAS